MRRQKGDVVLLILALLLVLILFGAGFAVHLLWIAAVVLLVLWIIGFAVGRGENAGTHRFYRW
jgi:energy-coupling factor transporter transmembrane protein EcfT